MPPHGLVLKRVLGVVKEGSGVHMLCDATTAENKSPPAPTVLSLWRRPWQFEDGPRLFANLPEVLGESSANDKHSKAVVQNIDTADLKVHHSVTDDEIARYTPGARARDPARPMRLDPQLPRARRGECVHSVRGPPCDATPRQQVGWRGPREG